MRTTQGCKDQKKAYESYSSKGKKNCSLCQFTRCVIDHSSKLKEVRVESSHTLFDQGWCVSKFWYPENDLKPNSKKLYFMKMLSLIELGFGNFHFFVICFFFICNFSFATLSLCWRDSITQIVVITTFHFANFDLKSMCIEINQAFDLN